VSWKKNWIKNAHSADIQFQNLLQWDRNLLKRVEANDPAAMRQLGGIRRNEGGYDVAVEYFKKAAELGNADAHFDLSLFYRDGEGVEICEAQGETLDHRCQSWVR